MITQPLTFVATANAIAYCHAQPVFVDVDIDTMGLSPQSLFSFLETQTVRTGKTQRCVNRLTGRPISACVPMHTFGHPCRIDEIADICQHYNIPVVEDAAESLGSRYKGQCTGTFGKVGVLSFNGNKILTTGGGGMLVFQDEDLAQRARHLTTQAKIPHPWEFLHDEVGFNYRMPNLNAALGLAQLEHLQEFVVAKRELALEYHKLFQNSELSFVVEPSHAESNYWLNAIILKNKEVRDRFLHYSNERGINTRPAWRLMNELPMYNRCQVGDLTNAKAIAATLVNIPSSVRWKHTTSLV